MRDIKDIPCPKCGAKAGESCSALTSGRAHSGQYHAARVAAWKTALFEDSKTPLREGPL